MVKDLVCGMGVEEDDPQTFTMVLHGRKYYFCSAECLLLFGKRPNDYGSSVPKNMTQDVVCGMDVNKDNAPQTAVYRGKTYYFCSSYCRLEFEASPKSFVEESHA